MGIVDIVTLPDPVNHYTTRTGDNKTKIPKYRTIENTDNGTVYTLTQVCVCVNAVLTRASPSLNLEST